MTFPNHGQPYVIAMPLSSGFTPLQRAEYAKMVAILRHYRVHVPAVPAQAAQAQASQPSSQSSRGNDEEDEEEDDDDDGVWH